MKYVLTASAALFPTLALAHAGDHAHIDVAGMIAHALSEPDHALALAAVIAASVAAWVYARRNR